nr:(Fe-S)-binding protein [uncultured Desulfobacter sp.]
MNTSDPNKPGTSRPRVGLFYTCLVDALKPNIAFAAVHLLEACGCEVCVPEAQTCCGRPAFNSGNRKLATQLARQNIALFEPFDFVVGPSGSCLSMFVKHYPDLLKDDAHWFQRAESLSKKSYELLDFLARIMPLPQLNSVYKGKVTYHDSCTGLRELNVREQPRTLLSNVRGLSLVEMDAAQECCGFGGTFSVKYPEISTRLVDDKVESIVRTGADTVTGGDLGCLMNIFGRLNRLKKNIRVFHAAEILAGMTGDGALGSPRKKAKNK